MQSPDLTATCSDTRPAYGSRDLSPRRPAPAWMRLTSPPPPPPRYTALILVVLYEYSAYGVYPLVGTESASGPRSVTAAYIFFTGTGLVSRYPTCDLGTLLQYCSPYQQE